MTKLLVTLTSTVGSGIGWWLGAPFGIMTAFFVSMVGMAAGVWAGKVLAQRWML